MRPLRRPAVVTVVTVVVLAALALTSCVPPTSGRPQIALPAYTYPTDAYLRGLVDPATTPVPPSVVILNIGNGETDEVADLDATADALRARATPSGPVLVIGYVNTLAASGLPRSTAAIQVDVDRWLKGRAVNPRRADDRLHYDGIFFDQTGRDCGTGGADMSRRDQLAGLKTYVERTMRAIDRNARTFVAANPGTAVADCYLTAGHLGADVFVTFEGSLAAYGSSWPDGNVFNPVDGYYDGRAEFGDRFWHIVYDTPTLDEARVVLGAAEDRGARYVTVSDDRLPNPYDHRPRSLTEIIAASLG